MIKIAVVEDESSSMDNIKKYIKQFSEENNEEFNVFYFTDGDEIASDYKSLYDIIFLDIEMKRLDGMSAAKLIRTFDKDVIIIFITNMAQYAIKGYSVDALNFLLKPVPYFAFSEQLKRSLNIIRQKSKDFILIPAENGIIRMEIPNILYIESIKHKIKIFSKDEQYIMNGTLKDMEKKLPDNQFVRCNSCYLVNLDWVKAIKDNNAIVGDYSLQISRPRKKLFLEALASFVGGK